jgi:hypothetical protein
MNNTQVSRSDILLAILAAANGEELSRVQLQKVIFLVAEEFDGRLPKDFYTFGKEKFGPFCIDIYNDTDMLHYWGWIRVKPGDEPRLEAYSIAKPFDLDGLQLDDDIKQYIKDTVAWVADMSFGEIVRAVYRLFPEYRENSIFSYSEEEAELESFARSIKQLREGKTYSASERLEELKRTFAANG